MTDTVITLIGRTVSDFDDFGQPIYTTSRTEIPAVSVPVTRAAYYTAAQAGIELAYEFIINPAEYKGESLVEFDGKRLKVDRNYLRSPDELEIYCSNASGLNEKPTPTPTPDPTPEPTPDPESEEVITDGP